MTFLVAPLTSRIGTEIRSTPPALLSGQHAPEIRALLEARGVVVLPGIHFNDEQQLSFARTLGTVVEQQGEKGIFKVSLDPAQNDKADYLRGTVLWHFDGFSDSVPTFLTLLSARVLSATGGQTEFANAYAAFDELADDEKNRLVELRVVHTMAANQRDVSPNPSAELREAWAKFPDKTHPLVWTHRSGRKSLLLGASASHIVGMEPHESRCLLDKLLSWTTQPRFVYRHEWSVGDLVMWDNTGLLHRVEPYPSDSGRLMHRVTLAGEESIA
jgi:alpha-ketoglutarate-dependent taurine dioxygenase